MSPRVSVVVAVWNPGPHFDDLIASLTAQSLPPEDFEVLLCDDGSDEATQQRLTAVEQAHANIHVHRLERTGWPGKPRNVGVQEARGRYVFFCDHDDRFAPEALERMCDYADENSSDVLIGKVVGVGRGISHRLFRKNVPEAVLGVDPLLDLLTPHKLFRTEFVRAHGIRFPDERVRLEDHMFCMQAYFKAEVISILADHPCYYWVVRQDQPSASARRIVPAEYFPHLETVLDIVEANTEPGPLRDQLMSHWYRGKILKRLQGKQMVGYPESHRAELLRVVVPLVQRRFGPQVDEYLAFPMRVRSALLRAGRYDDLLDLARLEAGMRGRAEVTGLRWTKGKKLVLEIRTRVTDENDQELVFTRPTPPGDDAEPAPSAPPPAEEPAGDDRGLVGEAADAPEEAAPPSVIWRPAGLTASPVLTDDVLDAGRDVARDGVSVFLRDLGDEADYQQKVRGRGLDVTVTVDPRTARSGRRIARRSEFVVQIRQAGWAFSCVLRIGEDVLAGDEETLSRVIGTREISLARSDTGRLRLGARELTAEEKAALNPPPPPPATLGGKAVRVVDQLVAKVPAEAKQKVPASARRLIGDLRGRLRSRLR